MLSNRRKGGALRKLQRRRFEYQGMSSADAHLAEIRRIWTRHGIPDAVTRVTDVEVAKLVVKAEEPIQMDLWYGKYCGPGTKYRGTPVDALDFSCMLHDLNMNSPRADTALQETSRYLLKQGLVGDSARPYVSRINSQLFLDACRLYRTFAYRTATTKLA